jgi:hypothetical protein
VLRALLSRWDGATLSAMILEASAEKRSAPMRLHIDRNHLDGNLIALVVITLLIAIAMVY